MKNLGIFVLLLTIGLINYVKANEDSDWIVLEPVESFQDRQESRYTRDNYESVGSGGSLLRSFRRTAARLQEYDGLTPTGSFDRTKQSISTTQTTPDQKVSIPTSASEYMIFFTMAGCQPCKTMYPVVKELQALGYEIYIVKRESNLNLVQKYDIHSFPTCIIFEKGTEIIRLNVASKDTVLQYLKKRQIPDYDFISRPSYKLF